MLQNIIFSLSYDAIFKQYNFITVKIRNTFHNPPKQPVTELCRQTEYENPVIIFL